MPALSIVTDYAAQGFRSLRKITTERRTDDLIDLTGAEADSAEAEITAIPNGTASGNPTVILSLTLPDRRVVVWETTLALYLSAGDAMKAKVGDPR